MTMHPASESLVFVLNQHAVTLRQPPGRLLLDWLRDDQQLTGTKAACREGDCGSCMVLLGRSHASVLHYHAVNACLLPLGAITGQHVVTIEGIMQPQLNPIQQALVNEGGIQCGFCTPGMVLALTAYFLTSAQSSSAAAIDAVAGNLCRCTGYQGIKRAIAKLCQAFDLSTSTPEQRLADLVRWQFLPTYFLTISAQLCALENVSELLEHDNALVVAGGTDVCVQRAAQLCTLPLKFIPPTEYEGIVLEGEKCHMDATTTLEALRLSPLLQQILPTLGDDLRKVCSAAVRQRATIGGNVVNASPIGDLAVILLALDASLHLVHADSVRVLKLRQFFLGYKQTALQANELLRSISFTGAVPAAHFSFEKVSKRPYLDIASVNSALFVQVNHGVITLIHLSAGGVAPTPLYLQKTSTYLLGKAVLVEHILQAVAIAQSEITPITDIRGSIAYKRLLLRQLIFAHFLKLFPRQLTWGALYAG